MAQAPGHKLGQIIGETLEIAVSPSLQEFATKHELYLDAAGTRPARSGRKVTWSDDLGNSHDLDHVLERGGSDEHLGIPVAFIETAWRRYTKHSRNKAQEIQGAILPLLATWAHARPFAGVILAGVWTKGSLNQLRSNGFSVLHVDYETIVRVFGEWNISVDYGEDSPDAFLLEQVEKWQLLSEQERLRLGSLLRSTISDDIDHFLGELAQTVLRRIEAIYVMPLYGTAVECRTVDEAMSFIRNHDGSTSESHSLVRFELIIRYDNDDRVTANFGSSADAVTFLRSFG